MHVTTNDIGSMAYTLLQGEARKVGRSVDEVAKTWLQAQAAKRLAEQLKPDPKR